MPTESRAPPPKRCCATALRLSQRLEPAHCGTYVLTMAEGGLLQQTVDFLRPVLPRRFRGDIPVVPVVRLSGVIGFSPPLRPAITLAPAPNPLRRPFSHPPAPLPPPLLHSPPCSAAP